MAYEDEQTPSIHTAVMDWKMHKCLFSFLPILPQISLYLRLAFKWTHKQITPLSCPCSFTSCFISGGCQYCYLSSPFQDELAQKLKSMGKTCTYVLSNSKLFQTLLWLGHIKTVCHTSNILTALTFNITLFPNEMRPFGITRTKNNFTVLDVEQGLVFCLHTSVQGV